MSEKLIRIFISVFVPKEIVNIKEMLKTTIDTRGIKIRWIQDGNMHLTLKFIGNTTEESIDSINNAIHDLVKDTPFINLSISGTGCFSKRDRANTLWVGIKGDLDKLEQLILNINNKLDYRYMLTWDRFVNLTVYKFNFKKNQWCTDKVCRSYSEFN